MVSNCNATLFTLCKVRKYIDAGTAVKIYKSIIPSKMQYGLLVTLNCTQSEQGKIQKLQNRALRICLLAGRYVSNLTLHNCCNVLPIALRCKVKLLNLMYK